MSFSTKTSEKFNTVFEKSNFIIQDIIVKCNYTKKGRNFIFAGLDKTLNDKTDLIYIGKIIETTPNKDILSSDAWLDISFPHVIYITGTRGTGKSFDLGVIIEGIATLGSTSPIKNKAKELCTFLIDTQNQFWTLKYPPKENIAENKEQLTELNKWNIQPNQIENCKLFIPRNTSKSTGDEIEFSICPDQVTHEEWCALIKEDVYSPQGHILRQTIDALRENYNIEDMIDYIENDQNWHNVADNSRNALLYKLDDYLRTHLFSNEGIRFNDLINKGQCNVFMLRELRNIDKSLITGILARQIFKIMGKHHTNKKISQFFDRELENDTLPSRVWLLIDEAHVVAPSSYSSPAKQSLIEYVKRGRDSGLSLVLATQQPSAVDDEILSQVNITFSHRLTFQNDINAAINRIPTKLVKKLKTRGIEINSFGDMLRNLAAGECFIGDHQTSRVVLTKIRPRVTSHGGYNPK